MPFHQDVDPAVGKTQLIRKVDIFALGPAMIYVGLAGRILSWMRLLAVVGGIATIVYNHQNYVRLRRSRP